MGNLQSGGWEEGNMIVEQHLNMEEGPSQSLHSKRLGVERASLTYACFGNFRILVPFNVWLPATTVGTTNKELACNITE